MGKHKPMTHPPNPPTNENALSISGIKIAIKQLPHTSNEVIIKFSVFEVFLLTPKTINT